MDLANFVVISRPGHTMDGLAWRLPAIADRLKPASEATSARNPSVFLLSAATPDVSSTEVRERIRRGESIHDLVPPLVESHIHQHGLYEARAANQLHGED